jgi:hypothetical protein
MSDRSLLPHGPVLADDFIPVQPAIFSVCVWGVYMDRSTCSVPFTPCDCQGVFPDNFLVRFYEDDQRLPGDLVHWSKVSTAHINQGVVDHTYYCPTCYAGAAVYEAHLDLDDPFFPMPGEIYWLEVSNNLRDPSNPPGSQDCNWFWLKTSNQANNYSVHGINLSTPDDDVEAAGARYARGSERADVGADMAFCLDAEMAAPPVVNGGCCDCSIPGLCSPDVVLGDCPSEHWDYDNVDCWNGCPSSAPVGDICTDMYIVIAGLDTITYDYDTTCSTTDGPTPESTPSGPLPIGSDVWVQYIAPYAGRFYVHMCATGDLNDTYDSMLAVYIDGTNSQNCACPSDPGFTLVAPASASDEGCAGPPAYRGSGKLLQPLNLAKDDCLTVRLAGYNAEFGRGTVHMGITCRFAEVPVPDPRVFDTGCGTRNRYLSFQTGSTGLTEAMRVTFKNLPGTFAQYNGDQWFVGAPFEVTEASGSDESAPPPTFWAATLQCGTPYYDDWSQYGVVHVFDAGIVPDAVYEIQAISAECELDDPKGFSQPLTIKTSRLGDVVGDCGVLPCSAPQCVVDFRDISAIVEKFKNSPQAPQKVRMDVINSTLAFPAPDHKVDFVDISASVDAFRGSPPALPGPQAHCQ